MDVIDLAKLLLWDFLEMQRLITLTSLQYLLRFAPTLDNLKIFNGHEIPRFYRTVIDCNTEIF